MNPTTIIQASTEPQVLKMVQKILLICGIISSLFYVGAEIFASMQWEAYSYASQNISELYAIGSPIRTTVISLFSIYNVLVIAFGLGIWANNQKRTLRLTGILLIGYAIVGQLTLLFFPMNLRGAETTISDTMHIIFTILMSITFLLSIGFAAAENGKRFRLYSVGTILIVLLFGALTGIDGPRLAAQLPTPWMGIKERINIYASMLWVLVLAITLLRTEKGPGSINGRGA